MLSHGEWEGDHVGCFFLLRRDSDPPTPVMTIHRVTRTLARQVARKVAKAGGVRLGYDVVGIDSLCDCRGAAVLESGVYVLPAPDGVTGSPEGP